MNKNTPNYHVKIVQITPKYAKELLAANTHNRKVTQTRVRLWAEAMRRGEWVMNAEPIKIAEDGTILDGQHRLLACVQSGDTFPSMIVTGLPVGTQDTMDTGRSRTLSDVLSIHGEKDATKIAAITVSLVAWDKYSPENAFYSGAHYTITMGEAQQYLETHPDIRDAARLTGKPSRNSGITQKVLGTLYYKFRQIDPSRADEFLEKLSIGAGLEKGDAILVLRNTVKRLRDINHGVQISPRYVAAITIKAWNKWIQGDKAGLLRYVATGNGKETFPTIQKPLDSVVDSDLVDFVYEANKEVAA